ncbi:dTDP-4-dehydrorhamnose 3,5-epimerase [Pelotomaculum propionicicum]|uniref:dTDP-4-dehydrorhamnose 3,5-epimerase n=1 Tax=Pelotomaculum propionicicum TaxID=258475 RepID=UPI003B7CB54D
MKVIETGLPGVVIIEPEVYYDHRGLFLETWNQDRYTATGLPSCFVQDNLSISKKRVLRGMHFQHPHSQGKLVSVLQGEVFDVAVDIRLGSPTFSRWVGVTLSHENMRQLYIPEGYAHGFLALSEYAVFHYKCTDYYNPKAEKGIIWSDPDINIDWPEGVPVLSEKDLANPRLKDMKHHVLPVYDGE